MKDSRLRNPVPAEGMNTDERLAELVEILATGLLRGRLRPFCMIIRSSSGVSSL